MIKKVLFSLLITYATLPDIQAIDFTNLINLKSYEVDDCFISFFQDPSGNDFVLKQIKEDSGDEQFLLVLDALACHMAETMQIPMNRITIIEPNPSSFPQKIKPGFPATLHTKAFGKSTDQQGPYQNIDIHQRFQRKNSPKEQKWGVLPPEDALAKYIHTLEALIQKYPPYQQEDLLLKFSQKAGFIEGSSLFNQDVIERIEHHKRCIKCNYEHSSQLVALAHKLLQR